MVATIDSGWDTRSTTVTCAGGKALSYELNLESARLARREADRATHGDGASLADSRPTLGRIVGLLDLSWMDSDSTRESARSTHRLRLCHPSHRSRMASQDFAGE